MTTILTPDVPVTPIPTGVAGPLGLNIWTDKIKVVGYIGDFQILSQRNILEATLKVQRKAM